MVATSPAAETANWRFMVRAFKYRNYRLFFGGQLVSLVGTWLTMVATSWLVYRLASRDYPQQVALLLGAVGFAGQIPVFVAAPMAGVWVDRLNRHRILIVTQALSMLQSFVLAYLALKQLITIPQVIGLSLFQGCVNAFDIPARQTFVVELVENRDDLSNAIALNSSMVHASRLFGPAMGGLLIAAAGEGVCFLIDGFSYLGVLIALVAMRVRPRRAPASQTGLLQSLLEGLRYAIGFSPVRALLLLVAATSFMAMSQQVLMPIFAGRILGGGSRTLGLLLCSSGAGALSASLYLASRRSVVGLGRVIAAAAAALGAGMISFSFVQHVALAMPILFVTGGGLVLEAAGANTLLQTIVPDEKRGRVMSLFTMAFLGMAPFGSMLAGTVADAVGPRWTITVAGAVCVAAAASFALAIPRLRPLVRPIFVAKGILPEVARAVHVTAVESTARQE